MIPGDLLSEGPRWHEEAGTTADDESPGAGGLYRLELDGICTRVLTGLTVADGIGRSPDGATMYLADSGIGRVEAALAPPASRRPPVPDR
jgi:sugar lactone lactonase YvrE